jgi:hypothetical protein
MTRLSWGELALAHFAVHVLEKVVRPFFFFAWSMGGSFRTFNGPEALTACGM